MTEPRVHWSSHGSAWLFIGFLVNIYLGACVADAIFDGAAPWLLGVVEAPNLTLPSLLFGVAFAAEVQP